ncbi:hypothetical protein GCM10023351_22140 [Microbacterium gilvum]|uniref:Uncharacterized protein n=1 Tax=Microbacterium gilvum TaxID=1336204 RepID=A0ABP9AA12_9MICO
MLAGGALAILGTSIILRAADANDAAGRSYETPHTEIEPVRPLIGEGFLIRPEGKTAAILFCDEDGNEVQRFSGFRFRDSVFHPSRVSVGEDEGGFPAFVVECATPDGSDGTVGAVFAPRGRRLEITYQFTNFTELTPKEGMILRETPSRDAVEEIAHGVFDWTRDPRGGIPFQRDGTFVYTQNYKRRRLGLVAKTTTTEWRDNRALHLPPQLQEDGSYRSTIRVAFAEDASPAMLVGIAEAHPLRVELSTAAPFNIWRSPSDASITATVLNGRADRDVRLRWSGRDFDGSDIGSGETVVSLRSGEFRAVEIPLTMNSRDIGFLEATVRADGDEHYDRTNVAVLPDHEFGDDASHSLFGIAAAYLFDTDEERSLLRRIGARRSRHIYFSSDQLSTYGVSQHRMRTPPSLDAFSDDDKAMVAYVDSEIDRAEAGSATAYELGNEMNRWGDGPYTGDGAAEYVDRWVRAFRRRLRARRSPLTLIGVGLAGMDVPYAKALFRAGFAKYADAFNLHPGRGNVTPDYAPDWRAIRDGSDRTWSYLGALKEARGMIEDHSPGLELWLTEVYACTRPNAWWDDSYRHAASNVLLSAALAHTVGVTSMMWFQLYDNIRANPHGARPTDREHHFGLLLRDLSPKPSLLAYAAAAENLDGASFTRWLDLDIDDIFGLEFETPRGVLTILWSRADGHRLNTESARDGSFYPSPEPWEETWKTKAELSLPSDAGHVTEVDVIGRSRTIDVDDGNASVVLDGAPRMYYGLRSEAFATARSIPGGVRQPSAG